MSKLPVSRVVNAQVNLSPAGAQSQSLSDMLVLGNSDVIDIVERMRVYPTLAAVATDFGTSAPEYFAAQRWFGQSPQPTQIKVGRWAQAATKGGLRCAPLTAAQQTLANWTAVVNGGFSIKQDGGAAHAIVGLDFHLAANLNAVAATITAALAAVPLTITCVWNATYSRFEFESSTAGANSAVSFLTAPGSGVDISGQLGGLVTSAGAYTYAGSALETIGAALAVFDDRFGQLWYGATLPTGLDADQLAAAAYIQGSANKHVLFVTTQDANTLTFGNDTCVAALLRDAKYQRACCQYSSQDAYACDSYAGRILTTDYTQPNSVITMKFKQEPGIASENLSGTQAAGVEEKNCNVFVAYDNNTSIVEQGVQCDGTFTDVLLGTDAMAIKVQNAIYNVLYSSPTKIPQTDQGVGIIQSAIEGVMSQFVLDGLLAPGVWTAQGFGQLKQGDYMAKGFYVYAGSVAAQSQADRAARICPPFQIAAKLAGAIHSVNVLINVNQ
jgi:hypothetical protein